MTDRTGCSARYHGTRNAYNNAHCRCEDARAAKRRYVKLREAGMTTPIVVDATGSARKLQALARGGWTAREMALRLGISRERVSQVKVKHYPTIHVDTASRVDALFLELWDVPGPSRSAAIRAEAKGYALPQDWDDIEDPNAVPQSPEPERETVDEVAVARVIAGHADHLTLTEAEKEHAARLLLGKGWSKFRIALLLHWSQWKVGKFEVAA